MKKEQTFYICKHCGNLITMVETGGGQLVCCGEPMTQLKANTVDAAKEKHVPVVSVSQNDVTVEVGSIAHPMLEEHHISWVYLLTELGGQIQYLTVGEKPVAKFSITTDDKVIAAYEYCNLHGLWKTEL